MFIWLAFWLILLVASIAAHEGAHVAVGKRYGWEYHGLKRAGFGVKMGHRSKDKSDWNLGRVALAGPLANLAACGLLLVLANLQTGHVAWILGQMATLNFALFVFNLLPLPLTDGGTILYAVTGWRMQWRYAGAAWIAIELVSALVLLLVSVR